MAKRPTSREVLRGFLSDTLLRTEWGSSNENLQRVLNEAIAGLDALDLSEVQQIFAPAKRRAWGRQPATALFLKGRALGHVEGLAGLIPGDSKKARREAL